MRFFAFMCVPLLAMQASVAPPLPQVDPQRDAELAQAEALVAKEPERAEHLYNLGVLQYRAGQLEAARESFRVSAERLSNTLAARSTYNRGTTRYREALASMEQGAANAPSPVMGGDQAAEDPQAQTIAALEESLQQLKDSIRATPSSVDNADARANAELAHRLLKKLKEQQKQDQKQDQQQEQEQEQEPKDEQQEQKDPKDGEEPKDGEPSKDPSKDKPKDASSKDGKPEQQKPSSEEPKDKQDAEPPPDGKPEPAQEPKPSETEKPAEQKPQAGRAKESPREGMSKQEIEQLLQKIRDREQERRAAKLAAERVRVSPAPKDW